MSQDVISDALNQIMNAKRARKSYVALKRHSKLLIGVLEIAKTQGYIQNFKVEGQKMEIEFSLNECKAIKPRYTIGVKDYEKYIRRYLPARGFGIIIVSTSSGVMTHEEASEKNLGGSLIAYFY